MSPTSEIAVEFRDVSFKINRHFLLSHLNLTIYQGEALVLLGRSGSGKTTTLKLINHLLIPTQGQVFVNNRPTTEWDGIKLRRQIGYVIQDIGLFPHFSVKENIALVPSLEKWTQCQIETRVYEMLNLVGLDPETFAQRYPYQLSGGQRQRVGVARALAADPPVLLMDEPFGALDPITRLELQQQFHHLQKQLGKTVVFVTHDIQEAFFLGTRIGLMYEGNLVFLGTRAEFLQSQHPEAKAFIACLNAWEKSA
ncbi:ATP-binding cassette domain-containing protein [Anabaena cylindrica FACHB-243]|uniref:ABC-type quaternary amine transporter n=1 Tax=Anabaena cylindrica (strain ATCC 27899 / PCC 7122) TaxID=272123 RepID=K9ZDK6_ANACC|nr:MULTISPECIES: ATP-binding cassette domain-containing protein [Anabaena]AFZ56460.1 Polyamine-transporting ATPase [Anabaena cylindrica PCC 7122]MBD2418090.1 ATP-binding cassette domain-containing protein [Anabaena cylindrica FACHB-243]MBY5281935.1 ATP-binding cassette domain-containing protein [Anabaena sp. CCAP 1446/1C]MBY5311344.1 ATP-binding cassette domain-containing protein [Anabaena sp. CCAP 1446/1C]MCM2407367.1 ATP-binding cassette domain-containing protein [Anabaena sp. CCAP 1446/1C]